MAVRIDFAQGAVAVQRDKQTLQIPRHFTLVSPIALDPFEPDADGDHEIELDVEVDARGRPFCRGLALRGPHITAPTLKDLPLDYLIRDATAEAARVWSGITRSALGISRQEARAALNTRMPRQGSEVTPEHLQAVAKMYRALVKSRQPGPVANIARFHCVHRSTAARWVRMARDAGYLGPAKDRAAGEAA